ncbi:MAG: YicC/YloC family endoribonuclease [Candidatus Muiribacteriota bacterium]
MKSMTGYASIEEEFEGIKVKFEIKSVNSKGFDLRVKVPDYLAELEFDLYSYLRKKIHRGKIFLKMEVNIIGDSSMLKVNSDTVNFYMKELQKISEEHKISKSFNLIDILKLPEVMKTSPDEDFKEKIKKVSFKLIDKLILLFNESREIEGQELYHFFKASLTNLINNNNIIKKRSVSHRVEVENEMLEKCKVANNLDFDKKRLQEEIFYYIEKSDVTEEIIRFTSHISLFESELNKKKSGNGKKFDFILQEMNREANTIASKTKNSEITNATIEMKDLISKMREQAANIE